MYNIIEEKDVQYFIEILGADKVFVKSAIHEDYHHDEMPEYGYYSPEVLLKPTTESQVSAIVSYCNQRLFPLTPRGAGTGLCGAACALYGGVMLSFEKMNRILEIDVNTLTATVEPYVLLMELTDALNPYQLLYPPDPGEKSATIAGNVMTNAGGMRACRYGVTKDYIKGIRAVLADGSIVSFGGKITKNSSGYNIKDLLIGSEGTLALVTQVTLKLIPKPNKMVSLLVPFTDLKACLDVVPKIMRLETIPVTLEFMEKEVITDAIKYLGKTFPNNDYPAYLIVSYNGSTLKEIDQMVETCAKLCLEEAALDVFISDTTERQEQIWNARGAFLEAIKASTVRMDECDVVVDINRIHEFLAYVNNLSVQYQVRIRSFGHAGDGNLHIYVCKDDIEDEPWTTICKSCMDAMYQKAIELNGLVSGEHGIGHGKKAYLKQSISTEHYQLMKSIKQTFDPNNILNPGKIVS